MSAMVTHNSLDGGRCFMQNALFFRGSYYGGEGCAGRWWRLREKVGRVVGVCPQMRETDETENETQRHCPTA